MDFTEPTGPPPKSGNYFGWRFSFFGLALILFTLAVYIFIGEGQGIQKEPLPSEKPEEAVADTIGNDTN